MLPSRKGGGNGDYQAASGLDNGQMKGRLRNKGPCSPREAPAFWCAEREKNSRRPTWGEFRKIAGKAPAACWTEAQTQLPYQAGPFRRASCIYLAMAAPDCWRRPPRRATNTPFPPLGSLAYPSGPSGGAERRGRGEPGGSPNTSLLSCFCSATCQIFSVAGATRTVTFPIPASASIEAPTSWATSWAGSAHLAVKPLAKSNPPGRRHSTMHPRSGNVGIVGSADGALISLAACRCCQIWKLQTG
ncbi:hypothetical protein F5144DRAFT_594061 [Chaetomium tenue]|uniref:Uncharacterized protein n=1 Tax=Chaetomium tenue TaxID=1854479 RepID=A0ACB7P256_9PEZI|nr:hypothetical protein F5144DRAFT_594061 [Chaetomium globosum]